MDSSEEACGGIDITHCGVTPLPFLISREPFLAYVVGNISLTSRKRTTLSSVSYLGRAQLCSLLLFVPWGRSPAAQPLCSALLSGGSMDGHRPHTEQHEGLGAPVAGPGPGHMWEVGPGTLEAEPASSPETPPGVGARIPAHKPLRIVGVGGSSQGTEPG